MTNPTATDIRRTAPAPTRDISSRIDLLRLLLIVGIMIIHIPYDATHDPYSGDPDVFDHAVLYLREGFFRAGVPALSVISGFLLARYIDRPYGELLRRKMGTLLVPFLVFNLGTFAVVFAIQTAGGGSFWPDVADAGLRAQADLAFSLTGSPINFPLYFLRDMMVCMFFLPFLFWGARHALWPTLAFLVFVVVFGRQIPVWSDLQNLVILRPTIPLFMFAGLVLGLRRIDLTRFDNRPGLAALVCIVGGAAMMVAKTSPELLAGASRSAVLLAVQAIICVAVWALSAYVVRWSAGRFIASHGSKAFWLFCTHGPALTVLFMLWMKTPIPYPVFYILAVPVTAGILLALHALLRSAMPGAIALMLGARTARAKPGPAGDAARAA